MFNQVLEEFGGVQTRLARACDTTKQQVHTWKRSGRIPPPYWRKIESNLNGKITIVDLYNAFYPNDQ